MDDPQPRQLKIDLEELEMAFESANWEINFFLDRETGQVVMVQENTFRDLENLSDEDRYLSSEDDEEEEQEFDLEETLDTLDLEDWERDMIRQADQVKNGIDERFLRIPKADSREGFQDMEEFVQTVQNTSLRTRLSQALHGKNPFRRFKDALQSFPAERERWFAFKKERNQQRIQDWLAAEGIKAE
jgi:hypothetical protein